MPGRPVDHASEADALQSDSLKPLGEPSETHLLSPQLFSEGAFCSQIPSRTSELCDDGSLWNSVIYHRELAGRWSIFDDLTSPVVSSRHGSADSEHDLAAMVHDFLENGSCGSEFPESSDGENGLPSASKVLETLQALKYNVTAREKELLTILTKFSLSIKEIDLVCCETPTTECNGGCIRRLLVRHLRRSGYNAAVCSTKWLNSGKVPGGEYEYIDVSFEANGEAPERLIVDVDFQIQFAIARPTHSYVTAMKYLPVIFVGSSEKLEHVLQAMAEAAKLSLSQNAMPLPPWRTLDYMKAKWMSPFERMVVDINSRNNRGPGPLQWREVTRKKKCLEAVEDLKLCITADIDKNMSLKHSPSERSRAVYLGKARRLSSGLLYLKT